MPEPRHVAEILNNIERLLRAANLWQSSMPSAEALSSQQPFSCDTLSFEQWLQFILLPRMRALLDAGVALPTEVSICPMAEEVFKGQPELISLIDAIADLDEALSGKRVRQP